MLGSGTSLCKADAVRRSPSADLTTAEVYVAVIVFVACCVLCACRYGQGARLCDGWSQKRRLTSFTVFNIDAVALWQEIVFCSRSGACSRETSVSPIKCIVSITSSGLEGDASISLSIALHLCLFVYAEA